MTPESLLTRTITRVEDILKEAFPEHASYGSGTFTMEIGSTQVMIVVRPFTESDTAIDCIATVVSGANISPELMKYLLRKNAELHFGAFALLFDDTITFSHSIAGGNVDSNELVTTLESVAVIADHYDDEIVALAGGKRAIDLADEMAKES